MLRETLKQELDHQRYNQLLLKSLLEIFDARLIDVPIVTALLAKPSAEASNYPG